MSKILITGSTGFIGTRLTELLRQRGHDVWECVRYVSGGRFSYYDRPQTLFADLKDTEMLRKVVAKAKPEVLINLGAESAVSFSFDHPIDVIETNCLGTVALVEAAMENGVKHFIQASTSEVYGRATTYPLTEDMPLGATSPYAVAKIAAEEYVRMAMHINRFPATVLRPFNSILEGEPVLILNGDKLHSLPVQEAERAVGLPCFVNMEATSAKPDAFLKHPYIGDAFTLETALGKRVRVTGDHSAFIWEGKPVAKEARLLRKGEYIVAPGYLNIPTRDRKRISLVNVLRDTGENLRDYLTPMTKKHTKYGWRNNVSKYSSCVNYREKKVLPLDLAIKWHDHYSSIRPSGGHVWYPVRIELSNDVLWLLGFLTAEGCIHQYASDYVVSWTSNDVFVRRAVKIIRDLGMACSYYPPSAGKPPLGTASNKILYLILQYVGVNSNGISPWILSLPQKRLKHFLSGYWDGDCRKYEEGFCATTKSPQLARDLSVALLRFGLVSSTRQYLSWIPKKDRNKKYPFYRVNAYGIDGDPRHWKDRVVQRTNRNRDTVRQGDFVLLKLKSITPYQYAGMVYDFSVPGAQNFIAGDLLYCHNTYGRALVRNPHFVVERAITQALQEGKIQLHDPEPWRDFMFRTDHCSAYIAVIENWPASVGQVFNICTGGAWQIKEMAETVAKIVYSQTGRKVEVEFSRQPDRPLDILRLQGSNEKICKALGWKPHYSLQEGLEQAIFEWRQVLNK